LGISPRRFWKKAILFKADTQCLLLTRHDFRQRA
jgi:hypothetical protein